MLEVGFKRELELILDILPKVGRQTVFFSSTFSEKVVDLASLWCQTTPVCIDMDKGSKNMVINEKLQLWYSIVGKDERFALLCHFLKKNLLKKVMVFFSSRNSVKFYVELLKNFQIDCLDIQGDQSKRTTAFTKFSNAKKGILLSTEVEASALDIPSLDWIVQYDPPNNPQECIHRVDQMARTEGPKGSCLFFLNDEESQLLPYLKKAKVQVYQLKNEDVMQYYKIDDIHQAQADLVNDEYSDLYERALDAFMSYIKAYYLHSRKDLFDVFKLNLQDIAQSFGFYSTPEQLDLARLLGLQPDMDILSLFNPESKIVYYE